MLIHSEVIKGFTISFYALEEHENIENMFPESNDAEIISKDIEAGKLVYFLAKITASKCGIELSSECLGGCIYDNYMDFWDIKEDYCSGMIDDVIILARRKIKELIA